MFTDTNYDCHARIAGRNDDQDHAVHAYAYGLTVLLCYWARLRWVRARKVEVGAAWMSNGFLVFSLLWLLHGGMSVF